MAYNSQYTGAQLDEAINLVLNKLKGIFNVSASDNDKYLKVVDGNPAWVIIDHAEEVEF